MTPKVYLISRKLTAEQIEVVQRALSITPLAAIVTTDPRDKSLAESFCERATALQQPIAILADFTDPLTAVNDDGTLTTIEI